MLFELRLQQLHELIGGIDVMLVEETKDQQSKDRLPAAVTILNSIHQDFDGEIFFLIHPTASSVSSFRNASPASGRCKLSTVASKMISP